MPFKNASLGIHYYHNYMPGPGFPYAEGNLEISILTEFKYYLKMKDDSQWNTFVGLFAGMRKIDHGAPDEGQFSNNWFESSQKELGAMVGSKIYLHPRVFYNWCIGLYSAHRIGTKRTDTYNTNQINVTYYEIAEADVIGLQLGMALGFHPFLKRKN